MPIKSALLAILVEMTGIEPARIAPIDPKPYIVFSFLWKSKAYPIGTGRKTAYLFLAQSTKKYANHELPVPNRYDQLSGSQSKLIILVDEIDRCFPDVQLKALSLGPEIQKRSSIALKAKDFKAF